MSSISKGNNSVFYHRPHARLLPRRASIEVRITRYDLLK